jgi:hypothetical protein
VKAKAKAAPKVPSTRMVIEVSRQLSQKRTQRATTAVIKLPTSWTRPVPTRLRIPSASFMMREMSLPT